MESFRTLDLIVIAIYFGLITLAGVFFARRNRSTEDYFLGGRNFPGWAIGLSMVGTSISSMTFLGYPGDAYKTAWLRLLPAFMLPVGVLVAAYVFLPFFRRGGLTSAYEYLEERFGPVTRIYAASAFIIGQLFRVGMILYLISLLVHELTGLPVGWSVVLGGVFVSFYTVAGGIEAVVWTDVAQTTVLAFGGVLCLIVIVLNLPGGLAEIFRVAGEEGKFRFAEVVFTESGERIVKPTSWAVSFTEKTGLMMIVVGLTNWLAEYSSNQNVVQRYCASRSIREARKAMLVCCLASVPIWTFFMFIGTSLYVYFQANPDPQAADILTGAGGAKPEQILPYFMLNYLPIGLGGLVAAAALAAAMSSLDSSLNAIATVGVVDIYRRHLVTDRDDKHYLRVARGIAIVASIIMMALAMVFVWGPGKTLQDTSLVVTALTAGGLLGLFLLGFLTTWGDGRAIAAGIVATLTFTVWMALKKIGVIPAPEEFARPAESALPDAVWGFVEFVVRYPALDQYYVGLVGHVIMFAIGFGAAAALGRRSRRDLTNLTVWTQDGTSAT